MKTLGEIIELVKKETMENNMCDYPEDRTYEETVPAMTLQEFDPIVAELVHCANSEGFLRSETYHWKEKASAFDALYSQSENLKAQLNQANVNQKNWQSRAYAAEGELFNIKEKARKARKAAKKA